MRSLGTLLILILVLFLSGCNKDDEDLTDITDDDQVGRSAIVENNFPGCVILRFPEIQPDKDRLILTNEFGYVISDTLLQDTLFVLSRNLEPLTLYKYETDGEVGYEGDFVTQDVSLFLQGFYRFDIRREVSYNGESPRVTLQKNELVNIIKIDREKLFLLWPQRESRIVQYNYNSCNALNYSAQVSERRTVLSMRFSSDSVEIRDLTQLDNGYSDLYILKGAKE